VHELVAVERINLLCLHKKELDSVQDVVIRDMLGSTFGWFFFPEINSLLFGMAVRYVDCVQHHVRTALCECDVACRVEAWWLTLYMDCNRR
jgi:hypothetical protein